MSRELRRRRGPIAAMAALGAILLAGAPAARAQDSTAMHHAAAMMTWRPTLFVLFDQLEYGPSGRGAPVNVDLVSWYGGARNRLWVVANSELATREREGEAELQLAYGRLVDPFFDAVMGLRVDTHWGDQDPDRVQLAVGFRGLAPYRFELAPTLFVSPEGDLSARLEAGFQLQFTQRLIGEPEGEWNWALQEVPRYGIRSGINDTELGFRLRYEFRREFAPYVGWSRSRRVGGSTNVGLPHGQPRAESRFVVGLRLWR
ncbi:MAG: copper resistance protein B [Gemmatimonadaceae bacterium]